MFLAVTWKKRCLIYFNNLVMQSTPYRAKCQHNYCFRVFWYVCLYAWPKRFLGGRKVVLFFRLSGSWFCNIKVSGSFLDGTNLQIDRGVTRLGGARGKMQVWRPRFEPEVFRKQMYCVEECTCDIVGIFWLPGNHSTPRSISAPREWFGAWVFAPPFPFVTPLLIEP